MLITLKCEYADLYSTRNPDHIMPDRISIEEKEWQNCIFIFQQ